MSILNPFTAASNNSGWCTVPCFKKCSCSFYITLSIRLCSHPKLSFTRLQRWDHTWAVLLQWGNQPYPCHRSAVCPGWGVWGTEFTPSRCIWYVPRIGLRLWWLCLLLRGRVYWDSTWSHGNTRFVRWRRWEWSRGRSCSSTRAGRKDSARSWVWKEARRTRLNRGIFTENVWVFEIDRFVFKRVARVQ